MVRGGEFFGVIFLGRVGNAGEISRVWGKWGAGSTEVGGLAEGWGFFWRDFFEGGVGRRIFYYGYPFNTPISDSRNTAFFARGDHPTLCPYAGEGLCGTPIYRISAVCLQKCGVSAG